MDRGSMFCIHFCWSAWVFIDPTFYGTFVCGPLQSFVVNVCTFWIHVFKYRTPRGYSWEFLVGLCRPFPQIVTLFSYSFGIETINKFIHSRSSLENHTRFQTKMGKIYTLFIPKRRKDPTRWGGTYLYSLYKGVPSLGRTTVHTVFRRLTKRLQPSSEFIVETIVYVAYFLRKSLIFFVK